MFKQKSLQCLISLSTLIHTINFEYFSEYNCQSMQNFCNDNRSKII